MEIGRLVSGRYGATLSETEELESANQKVIPAADSQTDWRQTFIENDKERVVDAIYTVLLRCLAVPTFPESFGKDLKAIAIGYVNTVLKESPTRKILDEKVAAKLSTMPFIAFEKKIKEQIKDPNLAWKLPFLETATSSTRNIFNQNKIPVDVTSCLEILSKANTPEQFSSNYENFQIKTISNAKELA